MGKIKGPRQRAIRLRGPDVELEIPLCPLDEATRPAVVRLVAEMLVKDLREHPPTAQEDRAP